MDGSCHRAGGHCGTAGSLRRACHDTMAMSARERDQGRKAVKELQGARESAVCPSGPGLGRELTARSSAQALHPRPRVAAPLPGRRSAGHNSGAIARAAFDRGARCGLRRRARSRPRAPLAHLGRGLGHEQTAPLEQAQYPLSHSVRTAAMSLAERCRLAKPHTLSLGAERHSRRSGTEVADQYRDGCFKQIMAQWKCRLALRYTASSASVSRIHEPNNGNSQH